MEPDLGMHWNETYRRIAKLVEQKQAVQYLAEHERLLDDLTQEEWCIAESLVKVLKIFDVARRELSNENTTIANVIPLKVTHILTFYIN